MIVNVTQEDIQHGQRAKTNACPVALAIKQTIGPFWRVSVISHNAYFYRDTAEEIRLLPQETTEFIKAFDAGNIVAPFSFEIDDLPTP